MTLEPGGPPGAGRGWLRGLFARVALDVAPLRESKPFRRLWAGQALSLIGGAMTYVAVPYQVYRLTGSTLDVGLLYLCTLVPQLVVPLVGGAIADAVDRRRMLLGTESALALVSGAFAFNASLDHPRVWALYVLQTLGMTAFSLGMPALRSLIPRVVGEDQIAAASALEDTYGNVAAIAGPAMAGLVIAGIGLTGTYLIDVGTFAASLVSIWLLPAMPPEEGAEAPSLSSIIEGFRYVRRQPAVLGTFLVDANAMVFGMPMALFPAVAAHLGYGATAVGFLFAAPSAGAVATSLFSGWIGRVRRQGLGVLVAATLWGAAIIVFGLADSIWLALAMLAVAGAADFVSGVLRSVIVLTATPDSMRGRVSGIEFAQVASAPSLGNLEAGVVASVVSVRFSVVSGGIACVIGNLLLALALPQFLRYSVEPPDEEPEEPPA